MFHRTLELGFDPYYQYGGYTYFYENERWRYADPRAGTWVELPRGQYSRETRYRGRQDRRDGDGVPDWRDRSPNNPRRD